MEMQGKTLGNKTRACRFPCGWPWPNMSPQYLLSLEWVSGNRGPRWLLQRLALLPVGQMLPVAPPSPPRLLQSSTRGENRDGAAAPPGQDVLENGATASSHHGADKTQGVPHFGARVYGFQGWGKRLFV